MSNSSPESLFDLSLNKICDSMTEEVMKHVLKSYPASIVLRIIRKSLHVTNDNQSFDEFSLTESAYRGRKLAQMNFSDPGNSSCQLYEIFKHKFHEKFSKTKQTEFVDKGNFCNHFDLQLFFKLVEISEHRNEFFTIFQICIQIKGFEFPKQLAEEWITSEKQENKDEMHFDYIEQGLKLGIFLGDSGWLNESALVLSHTYKIINTKWMCDDRNLKLFKITQCLTKWLLVTTNYHKFDEAKVVLQHMLPIIEILENIEGKTLCIANAYISVSQYYFVLMEYDEAWSWTVKANNELHDESDVVLKLLVISHAIKVCSALNKLSTAKMLIDQYCSYDKVTDQNVLVNMLLNKSCYLLRADNAKNCIFSYYAALDSNRNLFGYYNLHTAIVFVDYAYVRNVCDYDYSTFGIYHHLNEALQSVLQGIHIMETIGLPRDNMLLANAIRIKALIIGGFPPFHDIHYSHTSCLQNEGNFKELYKYQTKIEWLREAEAFQFKALEVSVKDVGVNTLLTANLYSSLGWIYKSQKEFMKSEEMYLKTIEIKESILGKDNPEVALSLYHLGSLYTFQLNKYCEAEVLHLRSKKIYETTNFGHQFIGLFYNLRGLVEIYRKLNDFEKHIQYEDKLESFIRTRIDWLLKVDTAVDVKCTKKNFSPEKFKCILNDCTCGF